MKIKFDVTPNELIIIKDILEKYLYKGCKAWVFGSRAKSSSLHGSDLDLAIECKDKIELKLLSKIKIAFEDSRLPYCVDVVDMKSVQPYFKDIINKKKILLPINFKGKVPILRFKEFSGEWEEKRLENIATFLKGKGISKSDITEDGILECIRYGELYTVYNETINEIKSKTNLNKENLILSKFNDIIIPASGETQIDIATASCVLKDNVALGGDLNIIRTNEDGIFLAYYLNSNKKIDIARLSQGISVVHLYSSQLKTLKLNLPQKQEQEKIASFLTSVDSKIEQLNEKIELLEDYKKGIMQKIFSQEIRFKNDDGCNFKDWEEKKLKNIGEVIGGGTPETVKLEYWKGHIQWFTPTEIKNKYIKFSKRTISELGLNKSSAQLLPKGTLLLTSRATIGDISIALQECTTNQGFQSIVVNDENNNEFIYCWILQNKKEFIRKSSGSTFLEISKKEVNKIDITLPYLKEQIKIANFLSSIDIKIELVFNQLEQTKEFKKALLQQMFV